MDSGGELIECYKDYGFVKKLMIGLFGSFYRQLPKEKSGLKCEEELTKAIWVHPSTVVQKTQS